MAETSKKTTQSRAKGRTTNGKAAQTGAGANPANRRKAKSRPQTKKKRRGAGGAARKPSQNGLARLKRAAQKVLAENSDKLMVALEEKALLGFASSMKCLVDLAKPEPAQPKPYSECSALTPYLEALKNEPEYVDPVEDEDTHLVEAEALPEDSGNTDKPQPGELETVHAVATD